MKTAWRIGLVLAGAALFVFAVERIGARHVIREMWAMGAGLVVILLLSLIRLFLQTHSWSIALEQDEIHSTKSELMFLRLASQGIGYLTVLGPAASEPLKIRLLRHHRGSATAATIVDTGVYWVSAALVLIAGSMSAALAFAQHRVTSVLLGATIIAAVLILLQPKALVAWLSASLGAHSPGWMRKAGQIESEVRKFAFTHPTAVRRMFLLDLACQCLLLAEVAAGFYCLHLPLRAGAILPIEAAGRVIRMVGGWMPARIGADESGAAAVFAALGLPPAAGLALALARRVRDMLNSLVGLVWLAWRTRADHNSADRKREPAAIFTGALQCKL